MLIRSLRWAACVVAISHWIGCDDGSSPSDEVVLATQDQVVAYTAIAPAVEARPIFVTGEVADLLPFAESALVEVDELTISNTTALADLAGLEALTRVDRFLVDQNEVLEVVELNIETADFVEVIGLVSTVSFPNLRSVGRLIVTGYACQISLPLLETASECVVTEDRSGTCEPPDVSLFPACT